MATTSDSREPTGGRISTEPLAAPDDLTLLTVDEVAALLKVSKSWVYEHTRARGSGLASHVLNPRSITATFTDAFPSGDWRSTAGLAVP
jgi:hypothetical protein